MAVQRPLLSDAVASADASEKTPARGKVATNGSRATRLVPPAKSGVVVALSGRDQLRGIVEERGDGRLAQMTPRIGRQELTAAITQDAVAELKLKRGDETLAIIKRAEMMIGR